MVGDNRKSLGAMDASAVKAGLQSLGSMPRRRLSSRHKAGRYDVSSRSWCGGVIYLWLAEPANDHMLPPRKKGMVVNGMLGSQLGDCFRSQPASHDALPVKLFRICIGELDLRRQIQAQR